MTEFQSQGRHCKMDEMSINDGELGVATVYINGHNVGA